MASSAVRLIPDVKGLLPVVAMPAEKTLGHFAHIHLVLILGHLERMVMTGAAL